MKENQSEIDEHLLHIIENLRRLNIWENIRKSQKINEVAWKSVENLRKSTQVKQHISKIHKNRWRIDEIHGKIEKILGIHRILNILLTLWRLRYIVVIIIMEIAETETSQHTRGTPVLLVLHRINWRRIEGALPPAPPPQPCICLEIWAFPMNQGPPEPPTPLPTQWTCMEAYAFWMIWVARAA